MKNTGFRRRRINLVGVITLLSLLGIFAVLFPLTAASQADPTPRPTPTPAPYIVLAPTQAVGEETVYITVNGYDWPTADHAIVARRDAQERMGTLGGGHVLEGLLHFTPGPHASEHGLAFRVLAFAQLLQTRALGILQPDVDAKVRHARLYR